MLSKKSSPSLIPPPDVVRDRLRATCREARLLRRLLRLASDARLPLTTADRLPPTVPKGEPHAHD